MSSNIRKRILQIDSVIDSLLKTGRHIILVKGVDTGFGRVESKGALKGVNELRSLMVGTIRSNRVNLRLVFIRLCSTLLFF